MRIIVIFLMLFTATAARGMGAESAAKQIGANRSLLARYESELQRLKAAGAQNTAPAPARDLENLEYKIKALNEDSERLYESLPKKQRADEFIQDLLVKETAKRAAVPSRTRELHEKALSLVARNRLAEASKIYEEIVLTDPDDDEAYIIMGHTYLLGGDYVKAETAFQNAVHIDPNNMHEITPFYQNMILKSPNDDNARAYLGFAYLMLDQLEEAKKSFEDALSINPDNEEAAYGLQICGRP